MKEKPIIMSGESVKAILEGRKSQTRRVVKPWVGDQCDLRGAVPERRGQYDFVRLANGHEFTMRPYAVAGDRLWVKESFFIVTGPTDGSPPTLDNSLVHHKADADPDLVAVADQNKLWTSPLFMPRWASRLTLELTDVRVEQLLDISESDAVAEGVERLEGYYSPTWRHYSDDGSREDVMLTARGSYLTLWQELNVKRGYPASSNPFVWVLDFQRVEP